jgi:hypothetical protein
MLAYAPRPSEASLKIYERSESINLLLLLEFMQIFANNCPNRAKRGQKERAKRVHRAVIHRIFIFIFKYIFKYFYVLCKPYVPIVSTSISTPIPIYKYTNSDISTSISTPIPIYKYTNSDSIDTQIIKVY